jgi:hypothetical protein
MAANYTLIEKITVGAAGASSVTFSGIPQTGYTDLVVKVSARGDYAALGSSYKLSFNGSSSNFSIRALEGAGSGTPSSFTGTQYVGSAVGSTATANTFNNGEIYIPNYTSTTATKSFSVDAVSENNGTEAYADLIAGLWSATPAAITSIGLTPTSGNFTQFSTFYLYGVAKLGTTPAIFPKASGGDTIMTDGTYWYHAFRASGTFTPTSALTCDVLVVAGGGGGGGYWGGGGGAGGLLTATSVSVGSATSVTVGAGGAGGVGDYGTAGSNSVFLSTTATGGGYGGYGRAGGTGGSGGGGGYLYGGGTGTAGQGSNGGSGNTGTAYATGGGGGAGAVGANASGGTAGNGGAGVNTYSSWASVTGTGVSGFFAGGGGGGGRTVNSNISGSGGSGGGGAGGASGGSTGVSNGTAGTANTGGGGGGSLSDGTNGITGGAGGSGLVIVRYLV